MCVWLHASKPSGAPRCQSWPRAINEWANFKRAAVCQMSPRPFASVDFTSYFSHSQESWYENKWFIPLQLSNVLVVNRVDIHSQQALPGPKRYATKYLNWSSNK